MGTLALNADERVASVEFADGYLIVGLKVGRRISVPLEWYPRLAGASAVGWQVRTVGQQAIAQSRVGRAALSGCPYPGHDPS
jgi:hypothetical protein